MRIMLSLLSLVAFTPAHLGSGDDVQPRDTVSVIESVVPALPATVRVSIVGGDTFLRIESDGVPVEVHGYDDEQYLRISAAGRVEVNVNSTTSVLNRDRYGNVGDGDVTGPKDTVRWVTIADDGIAMWHDHRIHWMSPTTPRTVDEQGTVQEWAVPLVVDGRRVLVSGRLFLRDRASFAWWLVALLAAVAAWWSSRMRRTRLLVVPFVSMVGAIVGWMQWSGLPSGARVTPLLLGFCTGAFVLGVLALIMRRNANVATSVNAGGAAALVVVAWMNLDQVRAAYVPGIDAEWIARITIQLLLGTGLAACADGIVRIVRDQPAA